MAQPKPWLLEIIEALNELGGHGTYKEIYNKILDRNNMDFKENTHWTAAVRQTIEKHSSDSLAFNQKDDLFYSYKGIGSGSWGLRNFSADNSNSIDITEDDLSFPEGKKKLKQHISRERNHKVIEIAKNNFKNLHGKLYCEICGFNFENFYGDIGIDYIEGHHILPVSSLDETSKTNPKDIVLLCANCHRMIHRKRPWLAKEDLKNLIKQKNYLS